MKCFLITVISCLAPLPAFSSPSHRCWVAATVQIYDAKTSAFKSFKELKSDEFDVTEQPHEDPRAFAWYELDGVLGQGTVWTGTLLGTPEGDVIQAHATVTLHGVSENLSLVMALEAPMAKVINVFHKETATEI